MISSSINLKCNICNIEKETPIENLAVIKVLVNFIKSYEEEKL